MAEPDLLGHLLQADDEAAADAKPEGAALAESLAFESAGDSEEARDYLRDARRMLHMQMDHLRDQHIAQVHHLKLRLFTERLKAVTHVFFITTGVVIGLVILALLINAARSSAVVIDVFNSPTTLSARGLTGRVVAAGLLDELTRLKAVTRSTAASRKLSGAWSNEIKVEVPETGVSLGEVERLLRDRFGHDLHIDGDLVETRDGGLALTVRGDGVLPRTFKGAADDLEALTARAAEYVYGEAEPSLFAMYLINAGRNAEAVEFSRQALPGAAKAERPYLLTAWGDALANLDGSAQRVLELYRAAIRAKPDYWAAHNDLMVALGYLGDEEGAWRAGLEMSRLAGGRPGRASEHNYQYWDMLTWNLPAWKASTVADSEAFSGLGTNLASAGVNLAQIEARLHDWAEARMHLDGMPADGKDPYVSAISHFVRGRLADEAGDIGTAVTEMEALQGAYRNPIVASSYPGLSCWVAPVEEAAGRPDKADAVLRQAGAFVDCYRFRGDILDRRNQWAQAQAAYREAVKLAPHLPAAYYSWGLALARHGDLAGAIEKLAAANAHGPHWADPLKAWGDVLVRQGRWREASFKYDAALTYAPKWDALRKARAVAAAHGG